MNIICFVSPSYQVVKVRARTSVMVKPRTSVIERVVHAFRHPSSSTVRNFMGPRVDCSREPARASTACVALVSIYI